MHVASYTVHGVRCTVQAAAPPTFGVSCGCVCLHTLVGFLLLIHLQLQFSHTITTTKAATTVTTAAAATTLSSIKLIINKRNFPHAGHGGVGLPFKVS